MKDSEPKVLIAIPSLDGRIHARLVQNLVGQLANNGFLIVIGEHPVARARNIIVDQFLKSEATHLWMIDDDTIPPNDALKNLLALDIPIATAITPTIQGGEIIYNIYKEREGKLEPYSHNHPLPETDRMIVAAVGSSCILIKREVFESMGEAPWYADIWTAGGEYCSEDIMFCNTAKANHYTIIAHPKVICEHSRYIVI